MIKILFYIEELKAGGAEKVLCNLVNNMDQSKFDITVQTLEYVDDPYRYLDKRIKYKSIKKKNSGKAFSYKYRLEAELGSVYKKYMKDDYDIEVAYLECGPTKIIAQSDNDKAVKLAWVHCDLSIKEGMADSVEKVAKQYSKFDKIICVSNDCVKGFEKLYGTGYDTLVVHNVVDEQEIFDKSVVPVEYPREKTKKQLLAVGRLNAQKNFSHLIETCAKLRDEGFDYELSILGEGDERTMLEGLIQKLGLEDRVFLKGFIDNPYPYIQKCDYIVCSSLYEGYSTVVTEALILGKPVITTPCTGMEEILGDSEYGIICDDSEDGLYMGIKSMLEDVELERSMIVKAEERGMSFRKAKMVEDTEKFFVSELERKKNN